MLFYIADAQQGPGTVIAHPGQDVELLCNVTPSGSQIAAWIINYGIPHGLPGIRGNIIPGYNATLFSNNLIIENIKIKDDRNGSEYRCVTIPRETSNPSGGNVINASDPTILYVAGEHYVI